LAAALLGGGAAFALWARSDEAALESEGCRVRMCDPARIDDLETKVWTADILFLSAGVTTVAATILLLFEPSEERSVGLGLSRSGGLEVRF
jgi:hypothetical protein